MSDTDDTDLLLLIPPNFFLIQSSDSEDYELENSYSKDRREIERAVVNDLITHVNELESRVCAIESSDGSFTLHNGVCNRSSDCLDFKSTKFINDDSSEFQQTSINSILSSSLDSVHHNKLSFTDNKGPSKLRHQFSLPSVVYNLLPLNSTTLGLKGKNIGDSPHNISRPYSSTSPVTVKPEILYNFDHNKLKSVPGDATNFKFVEQGYSVNSNKMDDQSNKHQEGIPVSNSDFHNTNITATEKHNPKTNNEYFGKCVKSFNRENFDKGDDVKLENHFELSDVDKLLKEMEETQLEIENKLKIRETMYNKSKSDDIKRKEVYKTGEDLNSVPDLGFGIRDVFYRQPSQKNHADHLESASSVVKNKDPIIEEPFIQSKISTLGHSNEPNVVEMQGGKFNTSASSSPLTRSPYKNKLTPVFNSMTNGWEFPRAKKKINFDSSKESSPSKVNYERSGFGNKEDAERNDSVELSKSFEGSSSADDKNHNVTEKMSQPLITKLRYPRVFKDFDRRYFRSSKSKYRYGAKEKALALNRSPSKSGHLMSLSDLWKSGETNSGIHMETDPLKLSQKLEEEKYKREHCEQEIHELQKRILDGQERLAVAVQVDKEKDLAIKKLWSGWQQLANHWTELEEQRHTLSKQLEAQTKAYDTQAEDIKKKVDRWEKELSKALDLAAGYKEKCHAISLEREELKAEMESKMQEILDELSNVKDENAKCLEENNKLMEKLNTVEAESEKDKQLVKEYQKKLLNVEQKLNQFEAEICVLRELKENLSLKLKDEIARSNSVTEQKLSLQQAVDSLKQQEKILKDEVKAATERLELSRIELRALYQGQLEAVVKEKLREFQSQLNAAEAALRAELLLREKELADQAAQQCHALNERHKSEIVKIEERHRSQLKAVVMRLEEIESQKKEAESKLKHETNRRTEIAQKLHSVMETQWRQALNIISSTAAPSGDPKVQLEFIGRHEHEEMRLDLKNLSKNQPDSSSSSNQDTAPFNKSDGMNTYRLAAPDVAATSDSKEYHISRQQQQQQQQNLKRYVQMLLDRTPGNPVPEVLDQSSSSFGQDETQQINSSTLTNDTFYSDEQSVERNVSFRGKEKYSSRSRGGEGLVDKRQQVQNINRIFRQQHQPWK